MQQRRVNHLTIEDVAREAGVSRSTASRALGGYGYASATSRAAVLAAASRLGYRLNTLARSMVTGVTHTIGLVVADIENPFFGRVARGVSDVVRPGGFEVIVANSDEDADREQTAVRLLLDKRVDGLIVGSAIQTAEEAPHLMEAVHGSTPLVLIDRGVRGVDTDVVAIDNAAAAREAVLHLLALGHRAVAIVVEQGPMTWPSDPGHWAELVSRFLERPEVYPTCVGRLVGYMQALEESGIGFDSKLACLTRYDRSSAAADTVELLTQAEPPTAVFAADNVMTLGVVQGIKAAGLRVPDDVSLVGFDDVEWTSLVHPPLTVVRQPVREMGVVAAHALLDRIGGAEGPAQVRALSTQLVTRLSTARPGRI